MDPFDFYARRKVCKVLVSQKLFDLAYRRIDDGLRLLSQVAPGSQHIFVVEFLILKIRCLEGLRSLEDMVEGFEELIEILKSTQSLGDCNTMLFSNLYHKGRIHEKMKDYRNAIVAYQESTLYNSQNDSKVYFRLAACYRHLKNYRQ